jgi:hypothetical protein
MGVTGSYGKSLVAITVNGCSVVWVVAMAVNGCYGQSMVAILVTGCYAKFMPAIHCSFSIFAIESTRLLKRTVN